MTPVETSFRDYHTRGGITVVKVATSLESSGGDNPAGGSNQLCEIDDIVSRKVEQKLAQFARSSQGPLSAAVRRGGKRTVYPKSADVRKASICRGQIWSIVARL